ncbi:hypothetical protein BGZ65_005603, partial [Modicella reniformis]
MPVTTRQGIFAVYQPETAFNARPLPPIHVLTPTTGQKNFILIMGAVYPLIFGFGAGVTSAALAQKPGYEKLSKTFLIIQYSNWVLILWAMALMFFYYGLKYTFILRANIVIAEAALKAPNAAFGISNLRSSSPARFLFIQLQITGFGGAAATLLAGSLCLIWVLYREKILSMHEQELPHTIAWFWTCAMTVIYYVITSLIAVQTVRNRRRGLHEPSSSVNNSYQPSSAQKSSTFSKSHAYSNTNTKVLQTPNSDSEVRLAQRSSDLSTLHSLNSADMDQDGHVALDIQDESHDESVAAIMEATRHMDHDAFNVNHQANKLEQDRIKKVSVGPPARPFFIKAHSNDNYGDASAAPGCRVPSDLRQTVFGGPIRATSPSRATSPTPSGSASPAFPMMALRGSSRNSGSKYGTSSETS